MIEILPQLFINALISGSIYALVSVGLSLSYGLLRIINFAHGHMMMAGVYFFYLVSTDAELSFFAAALLTVIFSVGFAIVTLYIFILPFSRYSSLLTFVSTMSLGTMLESAVSMIFGVNVRTLSLTRGVESYELGNVYITPIQIVVISSAVILLCGLAIVIHGTALGRQIRAVSLDPYAAASIGISDQRVCLIVFIASVTLTVFAGVMVGVETNLHPTMGNAYTIKAFAALILGGLGNVWGTVAGSYILGFCESFGIGLELGGYSLPAGYKDAFALSLILVVLLLRPEGIFGGRRRRV